MPHLKAYDKEGNILAIGYDIKNHQGSVIIPNLAPHTNYPQGEFYVSWEGDNYESEKTVVPEFTTLESSYKEITFYAKDILTVKPKTAYDIAVDNGFTGTEEEWVKSIKGEPGKDADPNDVKDLLIPYTEGRVSEEFKKLSTAKQVDSEVINARGHFETLSDRLNKTQNLPLKYGHLELPTDFKPTIPFTFYRDNDSRIKHNMDFQTKYKNGTKIYVKLNGDDSKGDGTPSKPYRTMTKAVDIAVKGLDSKYEIITNIPVFNRDEFIFNQTVSNKTISIISEDSYDESAKVFNNYSVDTGNLDNAWDTGVNEFIRTTTSGSSYTHRVYGSSITLKYRKDTNGGLVKVVVDGKNSTKKEFTAYSESPLTTQEEIYSDLDEGYHDVKVTYMGADPDVSYGGTPRLLLAIQDGFSSSYNDYTKAYKYSKNKTLVSSNSSYTWTQDGTGTYMTNRSSIRNVIDLYNVDIYGLPIPLKNATSIEECKETKNTWFSNGTSVWVHRDDEKEPTINSTVINIGVSGINPKVAEGGCIYFENFIFTSWITANPLSVTNDSTTPKGELCVNKCLMVGQRSNSSRGNGVAIEGIKNAYLFDCITAYAQLDGFNYHYTNITENEKRDCLAIEYNCKAYDLGLDEQGAGSNNASTAHEGSSILRIGTVGYRNTGATIIDVNGCYSILYDCNVRTPMLDGIKGKGRGYSFTTESTGRNGKTYLINCGSVETETSLVIDTNHVAYINNFKHDSPIQATGEIHFI